MKFISIEPSQSEFINFNLVEKIKLSTTEYPYSSRPTEFCWKFITNSTTTSSIAFKTPQDAIKWLTNIIPNLKSL